MALHKRVTGADGRNHSGLVDGDYSTDASLADSSRRKYWIIDLGTIIEVAFVEIHTKNGSMYLLTLGH